MTVLALPNASGSADLAAARIDGFANLLGAFVLLPGVLLGAVMFIAQSV